MVEEVKIIKPELSINKKLGATKFEQAFDSSIIANAENVVARNEGVFKQETLNDFITLQSVFAGLKPEDISAEDYKQITAIAFSIKSRAATGGFPAASAIANSLYKFCDQASEKMPPKGYKVMKLHFDALQQIFDNKFPADEADKVQKLVAGLEAVAEKFINE